jgi:hypothetical protein
MRVLYSAMTIPVTATMTTAELREVIGLVADHVNLCDTGVHEYQLQHTDDVIVTWR